MSQEQGPVTDLAAWEAVAANYASTVNGDDSISVRFAGFLAEELGPLPARTVLDVGCGHGWLAARLTAQGARVVGLDGSTGLLEIGRSRHPELDLRQADLNQGLGPAGLATYDRIVALMVLMDVAELDPLLGDIAAALAPAGRFIFTITHPCFWSQKPIKDPATGERYRKVRGYLDLEERWVTSFGGHRHFHRPLSWYLDRLAAAGLAVTRLVEPPTAPVDNRPPSQWTDYEVWMSSIPTMIGISACRMPA